MRIRKEVLVKASNWFPFIPPVKNYRPDPGL
jgi:hypothetical protein